jgi:hypothetical protein
MAGERLDSRVKFLKNQHADIANGESSNDGRRQGKGERMRLMADSMIRRLGFKNSILKQARGKVEQRSVLKLLPGEDQTLLIRRNALLVLNIRLDVFDSVGRLNLEGDVLASEGLHEDLHLPK